MVLFFIGGILTASIKYFADCEPSFSLSCGISALVAGNSWKWRNRNLNSDIISMTYNDQHEYQKLSDAVLKVFKYIWKYLRPLLFGYKGVGFQTKYCHIWMLLYVPLGIAFKLIVSIRNKLFIILN